MKRSLAFYLDSKNIPYKMEYIKGEFKRNYVSFSYRNVVELTSRSVAFLAFVLLV